MVVTNAAMLSMVQPKHKQILSKNDKTINFQMKIYRFMKLI